MSKSSILSLYTTLSAFTALAWNAGISPLGAASEQAWGATARPEVAATDQRVAATDDRSGAASLSGLVGGRLGTPVIANGYAYVPTGRTLSVWDYLDPAQPRLVSTGLDAPGVIHGLARHNGYLYASWQQASCRRSGVSVYSLADPARPRRVGGVIDYAGKAKLACAGAIVAAKSRLYLFDSENGGFVGDLRDPRRPVFRPTAIGRGPADRVASNGQLIWVSGRNFSLSFVMRTIDLSNPDAPVESAIYPSAGVDIYDVAYSGTKAYGFGYSFTVLDLQHPRKIEAIGRGDVPYGAATGVKLGDRVYTGGFHGMDVWSTLDPTQPTLVGTFDVRTFRAQQAVPLSAHYGLMLGGDDRLLALDARKQDRPALASQVLQPGGINAMDVAFVKGYAVMLQYDYGLTIADPVTLVPRARFEAKLADDPQARGYTDMAVRGNIAYLAVWGYGLIVVDLSDPLHPREMARMEYPYASSIALAADHAYIGKNTNGPALAVVDIRDPKTPRLLSETEMPTGPWTLAAAGGLLFAAEPAAERLPGGVRIFDLRQPATPREIGHWDRNCDSATDLALDAPRKRLYLACSRGLRILDISKPSAPLLIGATRARSSTTFAALALRGDRAWYAGTWGIDELDVSVPSSIRRVAITDTAGYESIRVRLSPTGRVFATTYEAGVHILAPR